MSCSTGGYEAEPSEVEAIAGLAEIAEGWPGDPLARYGALTSRQATFQAVVDLLAAERARVVAEMNSEGMSYRKLAPLLGMSAARVQQLTEAARASS